MSEHKLPSKFIKKIQGKDFVLFEGLLDMAHTAGLKRVETQLLQAPNKDNGMLAIVRAIVETDKGIFSALGDASPESAERPMQPHLVRLADTRAIARAMRLAVNVGMTAIEEINLSEPIISTSNIEENSKILTDSSDNGAVEHISKSKNGEKNQDKSDWLERPEEVVLSFGKHTDKTLGQVYSEDPSYVEWLAKEAYDNILRSAAQKILEKEAELKPTGTDSANTPEIMF